MLIRRRRLGSLLHQRHNGSIAHLATLRERYPTRDGMGHADRPRLDNPLGLDAQSRRVRLSSARRRRDSDTNANTYGYSDTNGDFDTNTNRYCYADAEVSANTKASSYSAAPAI